MKIGSVVRDSTSNTLSHSLGCDIVVLQECKDNNLNTGDDGLLITHETTEWHPHRILCKRFNIPDPYPELVTLS